MLGSDNYTIKNNDLNKFEDGLKRISIDKTISVIPTDIENDENTTLKVGVFLNF
jgi:hypothetical protein